MPKGLSSSTESFGSLPSSPPMTFGSLFERFRPLGISWRTAAGNLLTEQSRDYLLRITRSAKRMSALLEAVLSYSRVTEKPGPFALSDLSEIARDAVSDLELPITRAGAHVEIGPLPAAQVDPNQLRQLFQNLIANAVKYCKPGEPPHIQVLGEIKDKSCTLYIQDNGIGFSQRYVDRIFRPFQRLHGRNEYEGTGMGLAICRKIAERHGGTIAAKSEPGQGSVFIVTLPLVQGGSEAEVLRKSVAVSDYDFS